VFSQTRSKGTLLQFYFKHTPHTWIPTNTRLLVIVLASRRDKGMLAHAPLAIPQGTQLRGPSGSLRCLICRGRLAGALRNSSLRSSDSPRAYSRQLCATRPRRWDCSVRAAAGFEAKDWTKQPNLKTTLCSTNDSPFQAVE